MNEKKLLQQLSEQGRNIITTKAAEVAGISRAMLSKLCKAGTIQRIAQGQYMLAAVDQSENGEPGILPRDGLVPPWYFGQNDLRA